MRARAIVKELSRNYGSLLLTHAEDVEGFAAGDELYTRGDVPELVALELKRRGKTSAVEGPFVLSESERGSLSMASRGFHDNGTVGALCRALERAVRTLGPDAGGEWTQDDYDAATTAMLAFRKSGDDWTGKPSHAARAALDAVKHRRSASAGEPLSECQYTALLEACQHFASVGADEYAIAVDELLARFQPPAPKPLHRVAFEASIASKHTADSPEYWQEITAAVLAADKAGAK